jgi:hypothetical protein
MEIPKRRTPSPQATSCTSLRDRMPTAEELRSTPYLKWSVLARVISAGLAIPVSASISSFIGDDFALLSLSQLVAVLGWYDVYKAGAAAHAIYIREYQLPAYLAAVERAVKEVEDHLAAELGKGPPMLKGPNATGGGNSVIEACLILSTLREVLATRHFPDHHLHAVRYETLRQTLNGHIGRLHRLNLIKEDCSFSVPSAL